MRGVAVPLLLVFAGCNSVLGIEDLTLVDATPVDAQSTFIVRDGLAGYAGTVDTYVSDADTPNGTAATLQWGMTGQTHTLIRFDDLFAQLPAGATIRSATLTLHVLQVGASGARVYESAVDWTEATTYSTFGPAPGVTVEDRGVQIDQLDPASVGPATASVTLSLQRWQQDPASNRGWIIQGSDPVVSVASREATDESQRPQLVIELAQ